MPVTNAKNLSLQKKSAARLAAVQYMYRVMITKEKMDAAKQVSALRVQLFRNPEEQKANIGVAVEPNYPLYEGILVAVQQNKKEMDKMIDSITGKDWKRERMSPVLLGILYSAIAEMFFFKETPFKALHDEYSKLTRSFFSDPEVKFVYAAMAKLNESYE